MMMARASADITSKARENWLLRKRDPDYRPPRVTKEQPKKAPGSKKLVHGEWIEVQPDDEDAAPIEKKRAPPSRSRGGGRTEGRGLIGQTALQGG
jgi:hypothetical protein